MADTTVLVVDDEPSNLAMFVHALSPLYTVRVSCSGPNALQAARVQPLPELILLDVMMPEMDGYEVLRGLLADPDLSDIPVIFVTSLDDELDEEIGLRLGAVDYISKPVRPPVLLARVRTHLEVKRVRDQLRRYNAELEGEVERRTRETELIQTISLDVMLGLAETRDTDTGNHIARTQAYVEALGRRVPSLGGADLRRLIKAAPLHDIGKIGVPDSILRKPGPLTPEEWKAMRAHATIGADAIRVALERSFLKQLAADTVGRTQALAVLETAGIIAATHHEWWDGRGYPLGLRGEEIPLVGRIMAIADVYDALTSPRPYKEAWSARETADYIRKQRGKQFDPTLVELFDDVSHEFERIQKRLSPPS